MVEVPYYSSWWENWLASKYDELWDYLFENSQDKLEAMAAKAIAEYQNRKKAKCTLR